MKYLLSINICCLLLLFSVTGYSQSKKYLYYFDNDMHSTTKANAVFLGEGVTDNELIQLSCFNAANNKLVFIAHFTDSSLKVMQGLYQSYNNGLQESEGNYDKGVEEGLWQKWDTLGNLTDSIIYKNGNKVLWEISSYYPNGNIQSNVLYDLVDPKLDKVIFYDDKGNLLDPKTFKDADPDRIFTKSEIEASFPGGPSGWIRYITDQLRPHMDDLTDDKRSRGTCRVRFIVDKEGKVSNVQALTLQNTVLAKIAVRAISNGPNWLPAMQHGIPVKAYREQPVTFNVYEN